MRQSKLNVDGMRKSEGLYRSNNCSKYSLKRRQNVAETSFKVIGVALIFVVLFFVMLCVDKIFAAVKKCFKQNRKRRHRNRNPEEPENPAELVGSFKRYKN